MEQLQIHFQDGFAGDTVIVHVGDEMRQLTGVTTSLLFGFATTIDITVPTGRASVELEIPTRNLSCSIHLDIPPQTNLGVSIIDNEIDTITGDRPFGYS